MCSCIAHDNYVVVLWEVSLPLILYPRGRGYKEDLQVGCNCIPNRAISSLS
jgi:hypothetical protein